MLRLYKHKYEWILVFSEEPKANLIFTARCTQDVRNRDNETFSKFQMGMKVSSKSLGHRPLLAIVQIRFLPSLASGGVIFSERLCDAK